MAKVTTITKVARICNHITNLPPPHPLPGTDQTEYFINTKSDVGQSLVRAAVI
jgi:hypothetical protein